MIINFHNHSFRFLLKVSLLVAFVCAANPAQAAERCTVATLRQSYGYRITGFVGESAPFTPLTTVGVQTFDGTGRFTAKNTIAIGSEINRDFNFTGTYTVNPDCTGTMTADFGKLHFVIVSNGDELFVMSIDPGNNWSGLFKRL